MKLLFIKIFLIFVGIFILSPELTNAESATPVTLKLDFHWGRKSKDCRGLGICSISFEIELEYAVRIRFDDKKNYLILDVPFEIMKENEDQFSGEVFLMEEDFELPTELSEKLGLEKELLIKRGKYKMENTEEGVKLIFNL